MNTHYFTIIVRLRLDERASQETGGKKISGSLQHAGLTEIHYFDSHEKLYETLLQLVTWVSISSSHGGDMSNPSVVISDDQGADQGGTGKSAVEIRAS